MNPSDDDLPPQDQAPAPTDSEAAERPKRRRRTVKAAAPEGGPEVVADPQVGAGPGDVRPEPTVEPETREANDADGPTAGGATVDGEPNGPQEGRRGRNRRRGRRGGKGAAAAGGPDATGPVVAPAVAVNEVFAELLSGAFDSERIADPQEAMSLEGEPVTESDPAEAADAIADDEADGAKVETQDAASDPTRRVLAPEPDAPKLHKVLAQAGVGSRRDLEQMIADGRVTVNGEPAHTGQRISFGDQVRIDDKPIRVRILPPKARVLAYHKPVGEVVTHDDPQQRPTVFRRLPRLAQGKWQSVGRLDINTEGLLLFTNSGELANQLMHPRFGVEREYAVRSLGVLDPDAKARLLEGVEIDGQTSAFKSVEDGGGEGVNHWYRVVITEGRNREVRKLFEAVGHAVSRLIRIRYGSVVLPRGLKRGVWVDLDEVDVKALRRQAGGGDGRSESRPAAGESDGERAGRGRRGRRRGKGEGAREPREPREPRDSRGPRGDGGSIPNPLQQTFDKRGNKPSRQGEVPGQHDDRDDDDMDFRSIPNPLQQTYDKSGLQREKRERDRDRPDDGPIPNPLQQTYDKRATQKPRPLGGRGHGKGDGPREPDPMQTAVGYIGADAFTRKSGGRGSGGQRRQGGGQGGQGSRGGGQGGQGGRGGRGGRGGGRGR